MALRNAEGDCQLCGKPAPFMNRNGLPYLEIHHIIHVSSGGEDTLENTIALCPNCHSMCHHGSCDPLELQLILLLEIWESILK
jgi:5-methylcytosine-specific restriction protein A